MSNKTSEQMGRKPTVWTRDKISHLIHLYRHHECLWNHFVDEYRLKDHRNRAIDVICNTLRITKFDFGKKIHNLRNQFNSEMKKLERRIEEGGGNPDEKTMKAYRCRWEHFESLMFLQKIIEPRPGFQNSSFQTTKKVTFKYEEQLNQEKSPAKINQPTNDESLHQYNLEVPTDGDVESSENNEDNFQGYETVEEDMSTSDGGGRCSIYDLANGHKHDQGNATKIEKTAAINDISMSNKTFHCSVPKKSNSIQQNYQESKHIESQQHMETGTVMEVSNISQNSRDHHIPRVNTVLPVRDQWDTFGELIANEFRLLNSDVSRKKLKRKIMQDLLLIGEEDDNRSKQNNS